MQSEKFTSKEIARETIPALAGYCLVKVDAAQAQDAYDMNGGRIITMIPIIAWAIVTDTITAVGTESSSTVINVTAITAGAGAGSSNYFPEIIKDPMGGYCVGEQIYTRDLKEAIAVYDSEVEEWRKQYGFNHGQPDAAPALQ